MYDLATLDKEAVKEIIDYLEPNFYAPVADFITNEVKKQLSESMTFSECITIIRARKEKAIC